MDDQYESRQCKDGQEYTERTKQAIIRTDCRQVRFGPRPVETEIYDANILLRRSEKYQAIK